MTAKDLLKLLYKVTVPSHKGDIPIGTAHSVLKQAGLK
ncbi:type II toxin-antitoxin system HicA family toxin [Treponema primitia]